LAPSQPHGHDGEQGEGGAAKEEGHGREEVEGLAVEAR
jgi:hypothetical protein